jgi:putative acetyltransferase
MFELKPPDDADLPELIDLWVESWQTLALDIDFSTRRGWLADHLAVLKTQGTMIISAYAGHKMTGFITVHPHTGWLDQFAVHPDFIGSGVGFSLMQAAKSHAPDMLTLDVNAVNSRAVTFYQRQGFIKTGEGINPRSGLMTWLMRWQA